MLVLRRVLAVITVVLLFSGATPRPRTPEELYARRALRRARLIIELRLLEFRKERLECVRSAILRNLPPDLRPSGRIAEGTRTPDPETCAELLR
ncbi:MAG: hypothetical protein ACYC8W_04175 [Candidatus Tyrphobacter sp.]